MSNNLWNRVADFFKEWDGEDMTKAMSLYVDELRQINSNRIELIRLKRERKEIRNKEINNFAEWCYLNGIDFSYMSTSGKSGRQFIDDVIARYYKEQMKEAGE